MKKTLIYLGTLVLSNQVFAESITIHNVLETDTINIIQAEYETEKSSIDLNEGEQKELNFNIEQKLMNDICSNVNYKKLFDKTVEVEVFLSNGDAYMIQELKYNCN